MKSVCLTVFLGNFGISEYNRLKEEVTRHRKQQGRKS